MTDPRRVGHAQRRRMGAASNVYDTVAKPPAYAYGEQVSAPGRRGVQTIVGIAKSAVSADRTNDGHAYAVQGGKAQKVSWHLSGELRPFDIGQEDGQ